MAVTTGDVTQAAQVLDRLGLTDVIVGDDRVTGVPDEQKPEDVVAALVAHGVGVRGFSDDRPSPEELYVQLTGEGFDVRA